MAGDMGSCKGFHEGLHFLVGRASGSGVSPGTRTRPRGNVHWRSRAFSLVSSVPVPSSAPAMGPSSGGEWLCIGAPRQNSLGRLTVSHRGTGKGQKKGGGTAIQLHRQYLQYGGRKVPTSGIHVGTDGPHLALLTSCLLTLLRADCVKLPTLYARGIVVVFLLPEI